MNMRVAGVVNDSVVDGPGLRFAVFAQGCFHRCEGCHNVSTHDPTGGHDEDTDALIQRMLRNPLLSGLTLTGGDPLLQPKPCAELARAAKNADLNVWLYAGDTYEELAEKNDPDVMALLRLTDVLVDGPYIQSRRTLELPFRGSDNQRLIDVPRTLVRGEIVPWTPPVY